MSKLWRVLTLLVTVAVLCAPGWADKVTVDPNTPGGRATASEDNKADPRLLQKIAYDSGHKRLHAVVEDINQLSGMDVKCGRNKNDWRVRDIPVVVCVKDMPLGKLLRAIADATHTWFASERIGDNPKKSYRIYRRYKEESAIDSFFERRHKARLAAVDWRWDAMVAYGNSEEIVGAPGVPKTAWLAARLIASLGSDARNRLLAGETLEFRGSDPAYQSEIHEFYRFAWHDMGLARSQSSSSLTIEDMDRAVLTAKLVDEGQTGRTQMEMVLSPLVYGKLFAPYPVLSGAAQLEGKVSDLPSYPEQIRIPSSEEDMDNPEMTVLSTRPGRESKCALLQAKFDLEKPKNIKDPTFADLVRAVASASGCNIVTEDFTSHKNPEYQRLGYLFKKQTDLDTALVRMHVAGRNNRKDYTWFLDERDALLVGWANDVTTDSQRWRDHHRHILPQAYLDDLRAKLNGDGAELDDAVHVMCLLQGSVVEWMHNTRDFTCLLFGLNTHPAWQLYDALEPADKLAAKSDAGLALGQFDTAWIAGFFHAQKMREPNSCLVPMQYAADGRHVEIRRQKREEERRLVDRAMSDPKVIYTMVMRVESEAAKLHWQPGGSLARPPDKLKLTSYDMVIYYKMDGEERTMKIASPLLAFPAWSAEREAEMIKAAGAKS